MEIIYGNDNEFDSLVKEGKVLVDFYASWCGPCKMLGPVLESVANKVSNVKIVKIDVDTNPIISQKYGIMSIPTLILFKDGKAIDQRQGFMSEDIIISWINK